MKLYRLVIQEIISRLLHPTLLPDPTYLIHLLADIDTLKAALLRKLSILPLRLRGQFSNLLRLSTPG